ncbi:MAG: DUF2520 domain-containing protein [Candidatus Kapaibacterium sp.]
MRYNAAIIGAGKLGTALAVKLLSTDMLNSLMVRSEKSRSRVVSQNIPAAKITDNYDTGNADIVFLAIPDSAIRNTAEKLASSKNKKALFIHLSGSKGIDELSALAASGYRTAACHPYQAFYDTSPEAFEGIAWGIECTEADRSEIAEIIAILGGKPFYLDEKSASRKALYHLSAVVSSNILAAVLQYAKRLADELGLDPEAFIKPISSHTLEHTLNNSDTRFNITGPLARGDIKVIEEHIHELKENRPLLESYLHMTNALSILAYENSLISQDFFDNLSSLIKKHL